MFRSNERNRFSQYWECHRKLSSQWSNVATEMWRKVSIKSLLIIMQSSSTRRIFSIVSSMIAYFNASHFREMWSLIDDFLKWDRWWILRQSLFDLKTSSSENEMKNSRTSFTCAILSLSTWLFTSFVIMSETSLTKMRFTLKISWKESMYSIFASHWIMSRMTRVYVKSEWSRSISNQSSFFNESRSRRNISSISV
jgi:hypothetical protein